MFPARRGQQTSLDEDADDSGRIVNLDSIQEKVQEAVIVLSCSQAEDAAAWSFILALAVTAWATRSLSLFTAMGFSVALSIARQPSSESDRLPRRGLVVPS
jgi:hypothetical protein